MTARAHRTDEPSAPGHGAGSALAFIKRHLGQALLVVVLGCLIGISWLALRSLRIAADFERQDTHGRALIQELGDLLLSLKVAESGQRDFIITGNPESLQPYRMSLGNYSARLAELRRLTADDSDQRQRLAAIELLAAAEFADLKETIALRETKGFSAAHQAVAQPGKKTMDEIGLLTASAQAREMQLLKDRINKRQTDARDTILSLWLGGVLGSVALLLLFIHFRRELAGRVRAEAARHVGKEQATLLQRQNHDTFFDLVENAPFGMYVVDAQFRLRQVSATSQKVFGHIDPLLGRDFEEIMRILWPDAFAAEALGRFRHTLKTGEAYAASNTVEQRQNIPDVESYDWKIERIVLPDGQFGVVCYFYDITDRRQAENTLRESEARFRALAMASSDLMCRMSPDWREMRQIYDNKLAVTTEAPNPGWLDHYVHRDDQSRMLALFNEAIRTKSLFEMEHRVRHAGGSWGWMLSRAVPLLNANDAIIEWFGTGSDVTEQKRAEQALRESEERYRSLFNSIDEGFCIIDVIFDDREEAVDCRFLELNPAFKKQTGMNDMLGKRLREISLENPAGWLKVCGKVALTGEAVRFTYQEKPPHSLWFDIYAVRLGGPENPKVGIVFNNITQRTRADEALRQSEQRFRALFDRGPIAMYSCDASGAIQEFNRNAVVLWGREPKRGDSGERFYGALKLYFPDGRLVSPEQSPIAAVLRGETVAEQGVEAIIERPGGSRITVVCNIVPLKNALGEITGAINCMYDITERSRLQRETQEQAKALADLHRRKDEFLAMLSHELRNPLAPLASAVQMLRLGKDEEPLQQRARSIIERQVGQLKHLVDDLLEISRITSGSVRLRRQRISIGHVVERALETVQPMMAKRRHQLTASLPPQPIWLHADPTRLEQVLVNLLTNAAKYTDEGGQIWLNVEQDNTAQADGTVPMVVIRVRDTGIGIAPELLPRIFDMFTQAERSIDRSQGGLGIGLFLVQRLVELHSGSVSVSSVVGQGSEFVVRLPIMMAYVVTPPAIEIPPQSLYSCRVLVVDDSVDAAQSLAMLLKMTGHEVQLAYDGPGALKAALDMRPDVVLLDIGLPGLTGYEVAEQIRRQPELKNIVLVALTGYGRETDRQLSQEAGFNYHLVKPAHFDEVQKILAIVGQRQAT